MKVIKELKKQANANSKKEYRKLKAVKAGKYMLSIQGSRGHYCSPRQTLPVDLYSDMELAIINKKGSMVSINRSKLFRKFKRYDELLDRADSLNSSATVYGYVSVNLLNDLYCFLNEA
jgi:hypothetical protein